MSALYPTLLELGGLAADEACNGVSIVPLLENPESKWKRPALMTYGRGNHAVRSERWRYIRYADGSEELYDHRDDPNEWTNLANGRATTSGRAALEDQTDAARRDVVALPDYKAIIAAHRKWLPKKEAEAFPDLKP
jgi:arylsulfatase A-like enzyme